MLRHPLKAAVLSLLPLVTFAANTIDLTGTWQVALDRADVGLTERWFSRPPYRKPENLKVPFWLQPETHYTGARGTSA